MFYRFGERGQDESVFQCLRFRMRWIHSWLAFGVCVSLCADPAAAGDWPQWCGGPGRNCVSSEKNLPAEFDPGLPRKGDDPNQPPPTRNVKWTASLGLQTYGSPVVAGGRIVLGSTVAATEKDRDKPQAKGMGRVACFRETDGNMLWELVIPRLPRNVRPHSDTGFGVCSTATIEGDRAYIVSNRGELLCLDMAGQANGNDGPYMEEATYLSAKDPAATQPARPVELRPTDGDIVWMYDMIRQVDTYPHDASCCSPLVVGDWIYVCTGNAVNQGDKITLNPKAPTLIVLDKRTGRLVARDDERIGTRLLKGQWSSPSLCDTPRGPLIVQGAGDGNCYAFEPVEALTAGEVATLKRVWAADCNPVEYRYRDGNAVAYDKRAREGPSEVVGTPVCVDGRVYATVGRDPAFGRGRGNLTCIDGCTGKVLWGCTKVGRSISAVAVADGLVYAAETFGLVRCIDAETGQQLWDCQAPGDIWSPLLVADGKLYVTTFRGLLVLAAGRQMKVLSRVTVNGPISTGPCAANGVLYIAAHRTLYAVSEMAPAAASASPHLAHPAR
jgi:outer membrane protein assembly factor BamB